MADAYSEAENISKGKPKRKRPRGNKTDKDEAKPKRTSRSPYNNDTDSDSGRDMLVIAVSDHEQEDEVKSLDSIDDLPMEALIASTLTQFSSCIRPSLMIAYPAATSSEINAITNAKWKSLKEARRKQAGNLAKRPATASQSEGDPDDQPSRPKRRAAKNISSGSYMESEDYTESSPLSDDETSNNNGQSIVKEHKTRRETRRKGGEREVTLATKDIMKGKKFPKIKLKMIRKPEQNRSIFLAQTLEETEDSKGQATSYKEILKSKFKSGQDSDASSLQMEDDDSGTINLSHSPSDAEDGSEQEEEDDSEEVEDDSEGEHADYCYGCKDGGELLCCDKCPLAYHLECAFPPLKKIPDGEWLCQKCTAEKLPNRIERMLTWRWIKLPIATTTDDKDSDDSVILDKPAPVPMISPTVKRPTPKMREYFIKWEGKSYWKCSWVSEIRIEVHQAAALRTYIRKHNMDVEPLLELPAHQERRRRRRSSFYDEKMEEKELMLLKAGVRPEWLQVHRIINSKSHRSGAKFLVKWRELPYDKSTWEHLDDRSAIKGTEDAIKQYETLRGIMETGGKKKKGRPKSHKTDPKKKYSDQPEYITSTGGTLHPYQLEGINWLRFSWAQGTNTILADEMGLGKTIQTIAFIYSLVKEGHSNGPFLISAPLSTIINWEREFEFWAPDLYVVTYTGSKENRAVIRENEFSFIDGAIRGGSAKLYKMKKDAPIKFHVLLTSYEFVSVDSTVLQSINWSVLVVDEAHRLKNNQSKFFKVLSQYSLKYKLLLTGTPLQNNLEELFHLLNFLSPESFRSLEDFQEEFADISKEDQIKKLHEMLGPHLLRRLKADVLKNMPSKSELIVRVDLAPTQKKYYRWILTKNFEKLNLRGSQPVSLLNIMMDLKKCCNHPYLFPTAAEEAPLAVGGYYEGKALISSCGKLIVLEKMLKKLKEQGHRVLIFSQMTKMLDVLEDFLEHLKYKYERIDGSVTGSERQLCIDRFNAPGAEQFVFLLSTRAGGLGINLATADTVVIYDSDWNPHNDVQAFSRAHRIGQANKVMIYRFVTRKSVEERVCEVAKRKMMLTHLVVRSGFGSTNSQPSLSKRELDDILKFGTEDLFKDEESTDDQDSMGIVYDDKAIDNLLDRSITGNEEKGPADENLLANEYLGQFKVASYVMKEKGEPETEVIKVQETEQPGDPDFWEKLLRHHYEQQRELEAAKLGKGKRIRKQVNYHDGMAADLSELRVSGGGGGGGGGGDLEDGDDSIYEESDNEVSEEESDDEVEFPEPGSRRKPKRVIKNDLPPLLAKVNDSIHVYGFNPRQRRTFLNQVLRYGMPPPDAYNSSWLPKELRSKSEIAFNAYVSTFMKHLCEPDIPNTEVYSDGVPKNTVSRQNILTRIGVLKLIQNKINQYKDVNGEYSMEEDIPTLPTSSNQPLAVTTTAVVTVDKGSDDVVAMETTETTQTLSDDKDKATTTPAEKKGPAESESNTSKESDEMDSDIPKTIVEDVQVKNEGTDDSPEADSEPVIVSITKSTKTKPKLKFNIADGGFTELHTLWAQEKTEGFNATKWGRHHDYWLLKGFTLHGFCRWAEICSDVKLSVINKPFKSDESTEVKNRFLLRRYKLLEQALAVEEQLHRASNAGLHQNPNDNVMLLHSRFTDLDCLADGHQMLVKDCVNGNKNAIILMRKALGKMEELLLDMKSDVGKLSLELSKLPTVSDQLKINEISTLGKLAHKDSTKKPLLGVNSTIAQPSVITQGKAITTTQTEIGKSTHPHTQTKPGAHTITTTENLAVLSKSSASTTATSALQFIQPKPQTTAATSQYAAISMAPYVTDGSTTLLMPAQAAPLPLVQPQVLYWTSGQMAAVTHSSQVAVAGGSSGIVTHPSRIVTQHATSVPATAAQTTSTTSAIHMIKPKGTAGDKSTTTAGSKGIIHID